LHFADACQTIGDMLKPLGQLYKVPAVGFATVFLLAALGFGATRDFGALLLSILILPLLLLVAVAATIWAARLKAQRRGAAVAAALICLAPLAYWTASQTRDRARFMVWAPWHVAALSRALGRDGIVMGWDSWGFAGTDNFAYLAVDTQDRLGDKARAAQWVKALGQTCGIAEAQRMWPKLYVVTTYTNCPFAGVEPAG
jgi:hypothetical protein